MPTRSMALMLALCGLGLPLTAQTSDVSAPVHTSGGDVSGRISPRSLVLSFKGIPFAAPPVGDLRWRPPQPAAPWAGVRDGSTFGASCMQRTHPDLLPWTTEFLVQNQVSEDCLFLNVWTPQASPPAKLPVVVYIHGGAFTEGSGAIAVYDGEDLAATGLVVVTINYRLGALGFLAHPELTAESPHHSSGNYGILDQTAALRWVQANIAAFGGDAQRVTVWGQSAGAFSVGALLASPEAKGLFQRAMADSGLSLAGGPPPSLEAAQTAGVQFAAHHGAHSLQELRALPAMDLVPNAEDRSVRFAPVVDGWVLPESPVAANAQGADNDVPVLTGYQANDGMLFSAPVHTPEEFHARAQRLYGTLAPDFERLYPGQTAQQVQASVTESTRDRERAAMYLWAEQRTRSHRSPVYTYFFDRAIPWPQHPEYGAFHSGELPYMFRNLWVLDRPWEPSDFQIARQSSAYLKAFAESGAPAPANEPAWPAVTAASPETMRIGTELGPMPVADAPRFAFWKRFFSSTESKNAPVF